MRLCILLIVVVTVVHATLNFRCFSREYEWQDDSGIGWYIEIDTLSERPELLQLASIEFRPVRPGTSGCVHHQHINDLYLGWAVDDGGSIEFANYPTHCEDRAELSFGVSNLGSEYWGYDARHVTDGKLYAPQDGRIDMQTGTVNIRQHATRWRRLTARWTTGSRREPALPLSISVCILSKETPDVGAEWMEFPPPRIVPIADCVREFGGRCGVNVGWVAAQDVSLTAHTDENRIHPKSLENGWDLPSSFASGVHLPNKVSPHMHFGWTCDLGAQEAEAKWHLDGYTLHLNMMAQRCNDPLADAQPGRTFVWTTDDRAYMEGYKQSGDKMHAWLAKDNKDAPKTHSISHEKAQKAWKNAGVDTPIIAEQVAHSHGQRQVDQENCVGYGCCTNCAAENWWVAFIFFGFFLFIPFFILLLACWSGWDWSDWTQYSHPEYGAIYCADADDFRRIRQQVHHHHHHHHHPQSGRSAQ